jgi:hypothetical protein
VDYETSEKLQRLGLVANGVISVCVSRTHLATECFVEAFKGRSVVVTVFDYPSDCYKMMLCVVRDDHAYFTLIAPRELVYVHLHLWRTCRFRRRYVDGWNYVFYTLWRPKVYHELVATPAHIVRSMLEESAIEQDDTQALIDFGLMPPFEEDEDDTLH